MSPPRLYPVTESLVTRTVGSFSSARIASSSLRQLELDRGPLGVVYLMEYAGRIPVYAVVGVIVGE
jgi:hypothetical protein